MDWDVKIGKFCVWDICLLIYFLKFDGNIVGIFDKLIFIYFKSNYLIYLIFLNLIDYKIFFLLEWFVRLDS